MVNIRLVVARQCPQGGEQFEVRASGASSVSLAITVSELTGGISGASNIVISGDALIDTSTSGSSSIERE